MAAAASGGGSASAMAPPISAGAEAYYACRRCRTRLFDDGHLKDHVEAVHDFSYRRRVKDGHAGGSSGGGSGGDGGGGGLPACNSYFLEEALEWMDASGVEGKLTCPKCSSRVGTLKWQGSQCSCGTWVTPALQIPMSKVDKKFFRPKDTGAVMPHKWEGDDATGAGAGAVGGGDGAAAAADGASVGLAATATAPAGATVAATTEGAAESASATTGVDVAAADIADVAGAAAAADPASTE